MSTQGSFRYEIENSGVDQEGNKVTTVKCSGRLVSDSAGEFKEAVRGLIAQGGRIVLDLADVTLVDSSALGALVGLKVTAIKQGYCRLELTNMTPLIKDLLRTTNLTQMFSK